MNLWQRACRRAFYKDAAQLEAVLFPKLVVEVEEEIVTIETAEEAVDVDVVAVVVVAEVVAAVVEVVVNVVGAQASAALLLTNITPRKSLASSPRLTWMN
jgi:hypothetical protein